MCPTEYDWFILTSKNIPLQVTIAGKPQTTNCGHNRHPALMG
jgi:hypothetical protein